MTYRVVAGAFALHLRRQMRPLLAAFLVLAVAPAPSKAASISFTRVWPQYHDDDSFKSFYEYRTGRELTYKWIVLRSHPDDRGGLYFLVRVENKGEPTVGTSFVVRVISPDAIVTRVFNFFTDVPKGSHLFEIGLTGKDWPGPRLAPVAWEVELQDADGHVLVRKTSFLWEKPSP
jgi:hypothetical protein